MHSSRVTGTLLVSGGGIPVVPRDTPEPCPDQEPPANPSATNKAKGLHSQCREGTCTLPQATPPPETEHLHASFTGPPQGTLPHPGM